MNRNKKGFLITLYGPSGSGKSTFAKLLNMILTPTVGKIFIDGVDITAPDFSEDDVFDVRRKIGMVFQNPDNQIVANVVEEDVAFGPENLGVSSPEIRHRVDRALKQVGMYEYREHAPHLLSGGQKQRLCSARALVRKPQILNLDDSASALDYAPDAALRVAIRSMDPMPTTFIVSQRAASVRHADLILVLEDGQLVGAGKSEALLKTCPVYREIYSTQFGQEVAENG